MRKLVKEIESIPGEKISSYILNWYKDENNRSIFDFEISCYKHLRNKIDCRIEEAKYNESYATRLIYQNKSELPVWIKVYEVVSE